MMRVHVKTDGKPFDVNFAEGQTVQDVIDAYNLNAETFFIQLNGRLVHPKTVLKEGDELRFVGIIYGG